MKKPLYLDARHPLAVDLQGPALSVEREDCAPRWYPLARLSRIVSRGPVHWSGAALCACMAAAVPVLFLDHEGRPSGLCTGSLRRVAGLDEYLETVFAAPDGAQRFAHWQRSQEHRLIHHLVHALSWEEMPAQPLDAARRLDRALRERHGSDHNERLRWYMSLLAAHARQILADAGINPARLDGELGCVNLGQEITHLAAWSLRGHVLADRHPLPLGLDQAARGYAERLERPMTHCLERLVHHLWRIPL
ncbi:MAG: CRISPR-associated endonuclease Cas1 [Pseudomonadota bacterium]|nr:CRISPR-associated endonuclease Cas1 [Candidatus Acidoferrales bacterium]